MKFKELLEAKETISWNGRVLKFADGSVSSFPDKGDEWIVITNGKEDVRVRKDWKGIYLMSNKWDNRFKDGNELVAFLNKNGYVHFAGIDDD
jgi:hypothetical protein